MALRSIKVFTRVSLTTTWEFHYYVVWCFVEVLRRIFKLTLKFTQTNRSVRVLMGDWFPRVSLTTSWGFNYFVVLCLSEVFGGTFGFTLKFTQISRSKWVLMEDDRWMQRFILYLSRCFRDFPWPLNEGLEHACDWIFYRG